MTARNVKRAELGTYLLALAVCIVCVLVLSMGSGPEALP